MSACPKCGCFVFAQADDAAPYCDECIDVVLAEKAIAAATEKLESDNARLRSQVAALRAALSANLNASAGYFGRNGAEHEDPECPEDDTCECALVRALQDAYLLGARALAMTDEAEGEKR